jgi:hypothetical protein
VLEKKLEETTLALAVAAKNLKTVMADRRGI